MNAGSDPCIWCFRHPQQVVVGVCASCLKERLDAVAETPWDQVRSSSSMATFSSVRRRKQDQSESGRNENVALLMDSEKEEVKLAKDACRSSSAGSLQRSLSSRSSITSHMWTKPSPGRRNNASDPEGRRQEESTSKPEKDASKKKKVSLWSMFMLQDDGRDSSFKAKRGLSNASTKENVTKSQIAIKDGKIQSQQNMCKVDVCSQMMAPRVSLARSNRPAVSSSKKRISDQELANRPAETMICLDVEGTENTSWISSLLPRRGRRSKSISEGGGTTTAADPVLPFESARSSVDAARPSWDGALARRCLSVHEEDNLKRQEVDRQGFWEQSPVEEMEDNRKFSRSRSWGKAWSKTLQSPMWGLKTLYATPVRNARWRW